jgi:hypothetical protein
MAQFQAVPDLIGADHGLLLFEKAIMKEENRIFNL